MLVDIAARPAARDRPRRSLLRRRRRAERRWPTRASCASPDSSRVFVPPAPGDAGCALGAALYADRIYFRNPGSRRAGPSVLGSGRRRRAARARRPRGRPDRSRSSTTRRCSSVVADDLAGGRIVGWMDGALRVRAARARPSQPARGAARRGDARPAQPRHQVSRGVPAVRAGRAERGRRPVFRSAAGRRAARALHVGRVSGAPGMAADGSPR